MWSQQLVISLGRWAQGSSVGLESMEISLYGRAEVGKEGEPGIPFRWSPGRRSGGTLWYTSLHFSAFWTLKMSSLVQIFRWRQAFRFSTGSLYLQHSLNSWRIPILSSQMRTRHLLKIHNHCRFCERLINEICKAKYWLREQNNADRYRLFQKASDPAGLVSSHSCSTYLTEIDEIPYYQWSSSVNQTTVILPVYLGV